MISVLGIHGIAQQQGGRHQLLGDWTRALADGIERAVGRQGCPHQLDLAFYGDLFLGLGSDKGPDARDLSDDDEAFLGEIAEEVGANDAALTPTMGPRIPERLGRLTAWLDDRFGLVGHALFFGDLVQVRRFQRNADLHKDVLDRVRDALKVAPAAIDAGHAPPRVLIGHSLGSVIALEALCTIDGHGIDTLITLGSPLALRTIQKGLSRATAACRPGLPPGVRRWVNVYDHRDPVACAGGLAPTWRDVSDQVVNNGNDPHLVTRYLGKRATGAAVVADRCGR